MVGRHPHVFGDVEASTPGAVLANWEVLKAAEICALEPDARSRNGDDEGCSVRPLDLR